MYDLHNDITPVVAINGSTVSTDTTTAGNAIDMQGFESIEFLFYLHGITDGDFLPLITESDTDSNYVAVADADLIGTEAAAAFTTNTDDNKVSRIGYRGTKRYVKASIVSTNTATVGATFGCIAIKGNPLVKKTAANTQ